MSASADHRVGAGEPAPSARAVRCLRHVAAHPSASSTAVGAAVRIRHLSQASRLLARLERQGLLYRERGPAPANAWRITAKGAALLKRLPAGLYE